MKKSMRFSNAFGKFMFYFGNIIIGIIFVSPLIWMISASLKPEAKIFANMDSLTTFLPVQASLSNYAEVFSRLNMPWRNCSWSGGFNPRQQSGIVSADAAAALKP